MTSVAIRHRLLEGVLLRLAKLPDAGGLVLRALSRARSGSEAAATAGAFQAGQRALEERAGDLEHQVQAVARELNRTPQFRSDLPALARLAGLDALEVYDTDGRVVASAQFPEDAGRQVPGLPAALATLEFTWLYNDFFWGANLLNQGAERPITSSIAVLNGQYATDYNLIAAASIMIALPTLAVYLALQRHFISGLTLGATKG